MKAMQRMVIVGLMLAAACNGGGSEQSATGIEDFTVSGIRVIHKKVDANSVVAVRMYITGGATALTAKSAGIESLYLSAMVNGTEKYDKHAFAALAASTGTSVGGSVTQEYSVATLQAVQDHIGESWDLFTQAVLHPTFPDAEVDLVKQQLVFGLKQQKDDPDQHLNLLADSVFYAGHPFEIEAQGTPESVSAFTRNDLVTWQKDRLTKANLLFVVVGNITRDELSKKIEESFGSLPAGTANTTPLPAIAAGVPSLTVIPEKMPTNYIMGVFPGPARSSDDYPAFALAQQILSQRLFEEVRTKRNLTYAVYTSTIGGRVTEGQLYVTAVAPDTTIKVMMTEVKRMRDDTVSQEMIQEILNTFVTSYWMNQETNMNQADRLGHWELTGGSYKKVDTFTDLLKKVTAADLQRVSKEYFKNYRFVIIGDPSKVDKALFTSM